MKKNWAELLGFQMLNLEKLPPSLNIETPRRNSHLYSTLHGARSDRLSSPTRRFPVGVDGKLLAGQQSDLINRKITLELRLSGLILCRVHTSQQLLILVKLRVSQLVRPSLLQGTHEDLLHKMHTCISKGYMWGNLCSYTGCNLLIQCA